MCPDCIGDDVELITSPWAGSATTFSLHCYRCDRIVWRQSTSPLITSHRHEINVRSVLAAKESGISRGQLVKFYAHMNLPEPMHHKTWSLVSTVVHDAAVEAAKENMADTAAVVHDKYEKGVYDSIRDDVSGNPVIGLSYNGT